MKNNRNPKITVGNACFNTGKFVINTLSSVINQTFQNFELIIVDDASTDNSVELIENWLEQNSVKCRFIIHKENKGICKTANEIISLANGEYLSLVGDDLWDKDFLETCIMAFNLTEGENVSVVYTWCNNLYINENRLEKGVDLFNMCQESYPRSSMLFKNIKNSFYLMENPFLTDVLFWLNPVSAVSACIRLEAIKASGGYNEKLFFEDYDMWFKLSKKSSFVFINAEKATYVRHLDSFTFKRKYDLCVGQILILLKNYKRILYLDTRQHFKNTLINNFYALPFLKNEITEKQHFKKLFLLYFKFFKVLPWLFFKVFVLKFFVNLAVNYFRKIKSIIKRIIKFLFLKGKI
jgi:glycosyltransferase involved in cell wall biosynthesis